MGYVTDLLYGLAVDLDELDVGVWRPTAAYTATERGIVLNDLPEDPDEVVSLSHYADAEDATYRRDVESVVTFVQVRLRVRSNATGRDLQDLIRDRYHRRRVALTGGALIVTGRQQSRGPLGPDQNGRWLFSQNFTFSGLRARST